MKEDLLERINYFGIEEQKRKFSEEADELRDAIVEYEALKGCVGGAKIKKLKEHITEEFTDALSLLMQFQLFYDIKNEDIKRWLVFKNERTKQEIKDGVYDRKDRR